MTEKTGQDKRDLANRTIKSAGGQHSSRSYRRRELEKHLDEFNWILTRCLASDEKINEEDKALVLLASLPATYDHIVTTLLFGKDTLKLDEVIASLLMNESRRSQGTPSSSHSEVLVIESRGRSRSCHQKPEEKSRSKSRSRYQNLECHHCSKKGHIKKHCFKWKRENTEKEKGDKGRGGNALRLKESQVEISVDMSRRGGKLDRSRIRNISRCGQRRYYSVTNNGTKLLSRMHHVPDIRLNVISPADWMMRGYRNTLCEGEWKLTEGPLSQQREVLRSQSDGVRAMAEI
ncbi:hypothetical protein Nepgr_015895 [Nepenthes gracilis]|uniref:CCHC-type domain-containing protein n=1 Tax=Nepenthes gracilis TaxID=150966 RepID=A0AAD3XRI8_NEPGR|nr:hypothetical protein Nepgr_015895 [Nepenthes gracilis]